jgi:hypothetical protein
MLKKPNYLDFIIFYDDIRATALETRLRTSCMVPYPLASTHQE